MSGAFTFLSRLIRTQEAAGGYESTGVSQRRVGVWLTTSPQFKQVDTFGNAVSLGTRDRNHLLDRIYISV